MDRLRGQLIAQGAVDQLVLLDPGQPLKGGGKHPHLEVITPTGEVFHLHLGIGKGAADGVANLLRLDHGKGITVRVIEI